MKRINYKVVDKKIGALYFIICLAKAVSSGYFVVTRVAMDYFSKNNISVLTISEWLVIDSVLTVLFVVFYMKMLKEQERIAKEAFDK